DGLRHRGHDQFRAWRGIYDRRVYRAARDSVAVRGRRDMGAAGAAPGTLDFDGADRGLGLDHRAHRLPSLTLLLPARTADHGHRHVDYAAELRADRPGRALEV